MTNETRRAIAWLKAAADGAPGASTGERLAYALAFNRLDLLRSYNKREAIERIGPDWWEACKIVAAERKMGR